MHQSELATATPEEIDADHNGWLTLLDRRITEAENNTVAGAYYGSIVAVALFLIGMGAKFIGTMDFGKSLGAGTSLGAFGGFLAFAGVVVLRDPNKKAHAWATSAAQGVTTRLSRDEAPQAPAPPVLEIVEHEEPQRPIAV